MVGGSERCTGGISLPLYSEKLSRVYSSIMVELSFDTFSQPDAGTEVGPSSCAGIITTIGGGNDSCLHSLAGYPDVHDDCYRVDLC